MLSIYSAHYRVMEKFKNKLDQAFIFVLFRDMSRVEQRIPYATLHILELLQAFLKCLAMYCQPQRF